MWVRRTGRAHAVHGVVLRGPPARAFPDGLGDAHRASAGRVREPRGRPGAGPIAAPGVAPNSCGSSAAAAAPDPSTVRSAGLHASNSCRAAHLPAARGEPVSWTPFVAAALLLVVAPLLPGIAVKSRAYLTGRRGPPVL